MAGNGLEQTGKPVSIGSPTLLYQAESAAGLKLWPAEAPRLPWPNLLP